MLYTKSAYTMLTEFLRNTVEFGETWE